MSSDLSKDQVSVYSSPNRSACITSMSSVRKLSFLDTRPTQQEGGCNATKLVGSIRTYAVRLPPFSLIPRVLHKIVQDQVHVMILVVAIWQRQPCYPRLLKLLLVHLIIIRHMPNLLLNAQKDVHPLVANNTLRLAACKVSENLLVG